MYSFHLSIDIQQPIDTVIRLYPDRTLFPRWQPGLVSDELISGKNGESFYKMTYGKGRRKLIISETVMRQELPDHYDVRYEMKGVTNTAQNSFISVSPTVTRWNAEVTYSFKGLKNLIATYMRTNFENQSVLIMKNFKGFAESFR